MIHLVGPDFVEEVRQLARVGKITIMKEEAAVSLVRVLVEMFQPLCMEGARPADETMDHIVLGKEELGEIRTILAGDTRNKGDLCHGLFLR